MSVTTEGSEEIFVQVTRETRQASKINQICTKIDEILAQNLNKTLVKITLPELVECDVHVRQAIRDKYDPEIINNDLYIKIDGGHKEDIQANFLISGRVHNPNWFVALNTCCVMAGNECKPDVGVWFQRPTYQQLHNPIANQCPPPNVYIEVFYNRDPDRQRAFDKLVVIQQNFPAIEFVGIALPDRQGPFHQNPNPGVASAPSTPENPPNVRPNRAPYFIYWNGTNAIYYKFNWNEHLVLGCGWTLELNNVLGSISMP
ncbi:unnamed protein product [Rhizophagus irregularis]|uniref:Uncharacterized protein n=1 Tax=Rhizophagus irregularis TaxID=588596 RepID=A0A2I1EC91_9GLOM|nr:hypothetical protein RhiirB3_407283 [Rhizophagus irregularis]CAB4495100.1 unnamed protein product [Rhizophagus irregularis]CAB5190219.1 unnamed protein product [Rhizophagus irregularis]CAB5395969.1 unnamed protein product [Rhizophagus irregularis]